MTEYPADIIETVAKAIESAKISWLDNRPDAVIRAIAALDALGLVFEYGTAIKEPDGTLWDHFSHEADTPDEIRSAIADDERPIALIWRIAETPWVEVPDAD